MNPITATPAAEPAVPLKTWIAAGGALIGAFLAVLNIQITNASLPYIEGGIGTGGVYGTWISTAYLIGEIIVIPLTDFLSVYSRCGAICWPIRRCSCSFRCCAATPAASAR